MFGRSKRRKGGDDEPVRGDIGMAADDLQDGDMPDAFASTEADQAEPGGDGIPADIPEDQRELMLQSREARSVAMARNRRDDQMRMTVFSCACVVAGFCGIAGIIFGTAAVCRSLGNTGSVAASPVQQPSYVAGVDPSTMDTYYDQSGRMHVNVYMTKQPDVDITIHVDPDGNVTAEAGQRPAGGDAGDTGASGQPGEAAGMDDDGTGQGTEQAEGVTGTESGGDGQQQGTVQEPEGATGDEGDTAAGDDGSSHGTEDPEDATGQTGPGTGTGADEQPAATSKTEQEILEEQSKREEGGSSGYLETDGQYVVKRGDTLGAISNRLGFSVDFLASYNHIKDKNLIITGEVLRYPVFD